MNVAFCTASTDNNAGSDECYTVAHLPCMAKHYLANPASEEAKSGKVVNPILPHTGRCPGCKTRTDWGEIIRAIYARRDGEKEDVQLAEKTRLRDMKAAELAEKKRMAEEDKEAKRRQAQEVKAEKCRERELEKAAKAKGKGRSRSKVADSSDTD